MVSNQKIVYSSAQEEAAIAGAEWLKLTKTEILTSKCDKMKDQG